MTDTHYIERKDLTATEIIDAVDAGSRIVIEIEFLGKPIRMAIRKRNETYYCDTPVKLLTYDTEAEMRTCLERYRLAKPEGESSREDELELSGRSDSHNPK
ncbi:hypothetical protein [Natronorubrum thiooxidans]|uniref:DUF8001 domain-containing protein n=1 Tax=Natronorubrum thiooxidans TaxID=308853 RepID=A0A1N7GLQ1_9EURY|nr:hypothetical protein [Natronorubrum thiooxidans]SIS13480.1 hypothetical protein SAMN05421752_11352 [Natronorubrum thiooxidans]